MKIDPLKYKEAYLKEANSHLKVINTALLKLEKSPTSSNYLREIFHAVHTLKSLAATINYVDTAQLCHLIEDMIDAIRNKKLSLDNCIEILFKSFDHLKSNLTRIENNEEELESDSLLTQLHSVLNHQAIKEDSPTSSDEIPHNAIEKIKSLEVKVEHLDTLMNLTEELLVCKMKFDLIQDQIENPDLNVAIESLSRVITDLQYRVMQVRLMPVEFIFNRFLRMVRDIAKQQKKQIEIVIEGGEIELDRLLLDEVSEAIAHLIRNAIDHGLEDTATRKKNGKPEKGTITLKALRSKDSAIIEIKDDGKGLNLGAIKAIALKHHIITENATEDEIKNCIFSNISTRTTVSQISGRGLGLSIVKEKIDSIGGSIQVHSVPGSSTTFSIKIPLTLAIINMLFVKAGGETYAIPIDAIERLLSISTNEIKEILNNQAIIYEEKDIPVLTLSTLFGRKPTSLSKLSIVIIQKGNTRMGLAVDTLLVTQEVVIKPLNRTLKNNKFFSGIAMIGSGEIVLIIDVNYLLNMKTKLVMDIN